MSLYTNIYATYAVYMGAYARGLICPVEIPLCPSFYIQTTKLYSCDAEVLRCDRYSSHSPVMQPTSMSRASKIAWSWTPALVKADLTRTTNESITLDKTYLTKTKHICHHSTATSLRRDRFFHLHCIKTYLKSSWHWNHGRHESMSKASASISSFRISFSLGCHLPAGVRLRHCVLWMLDDVGIKNQIDFMENCQLPPH